MADPSELIPLRIGDCRFDPRSHEIERAGVIQRLPHKQSALLLALARAAPQVLSRQTLMDTVWDRRMVEEAVLSRAIAELRRALDDSGRDGRYIETIPKSGYRLIAPVRPWRDETAAPESTSSAIDPKLAAPSVPVVVTPHHNRLTFVGIGLAVSGVIALVAYWFVATSPDKQDVNPIDAADLARIRPLTSDPGYEYRADLSADGRWVVYTQTDPDGGSSRLWLQDINGQHRELLTAEDHIEFRPALSPDGKQIVFLRDVESRCALFVRATTGGDSRHLADCGTPAGTPAWSADQRTIVFTSAAEPGFAAGLSVLDPATGAITALTRPSIAEGPDRDPEWVPHQRAITFARGYEGEQHLLRIDLDLPDAAPKVLFDAGRLQGHAWYADGSRLLIASDAPGYRTLLLLDADGRQVLALNTRGAQFPSLATNGELVFESAQYDANIERVDLANAGTEPVTVVDSTRYDASPVLSPDGTSLAFVSNREDYEHVYLADPDGRNTKRVAFTDGTRWSRPSFSPDGRFVLATGYDHDNVDWIYRFDRFREQSEQLKELGPHASRALYQPNGSGVVFMRRNAEGERSLWRFDGGSGQLPQPIAHTDGVEHVEWVGQDLIAKRRNHPGFQLIRGPDFATIEPRFTELEPITTSAWTTRHRALFLVVRESGRHVLKRADLDNTSVVDIAAPIDADAVGPSLAISFDEKTLWFARTASLQIDLMRLPARDATLEDAR